MEIFFYVSFGICLISLGMAFFLIKWAKENSELKRRCDRLERSQKSKCRTQAHADRWNKLWAVIRKKFNLVKRQDGTWSGGQPAQEILNLMRANFGTFSIKEIEFMEQLVNFIRRASLIQQKESNFVAKYLGNRMPPDPSAN
jgi:hypothetical protein